MTAREEMYSRMEDAMRDNARLLVAEREAHRETAAELARLKQQSPRDSLIWFLFLCALCWVGYLIGYTVAWWLG